MISLGSCLEVGESINQSTRSVFFVPVTAWSDCSQAWPGKILWRSMHNE